MAESKTLNEIIHRFNAKQQDYLVHCIQKYGDRKDFHRGLLPFVPSDMAFRALTMHLGFLGQYTDTDPDVLKSMRFARGILSLVKEVQENRLYSDEASKVIFLDDIKLLRHFKKRYAHKFYTIYRPANTDTLIGLERMKKNYWKVTARKMHLEGLVEILSDNFS